MGESPTLGKFGGNLGRGKEEKGKVEGKRGGKGKERQGKRGKWRGKEGKL